MLSLLGSVYNYKEEHHHGVPLYGFPIGTISKVKKILVGFRCKCMMNIAMCQIFFYVIKHIYKTYDLVLLKNTDITC